MLRLILSIMVGIMFTPLAGIVFWFVWGILFDE